MACGHWVEISERLIALISRERRRRVGSRLAGNRAAHFADNVFAGGGSILGQRPEWPEGNSITDGLDSVKFVKLNHGLDGDYHLATSSKFKGKATDGRDPGADVDLVLAAIRGVR